MQELDSDSVEVEGGRVTNIIVAAERLDTVVVALVALQTGVAVGTGMAVAVEELGTGVEVEGIMAADTSLAVLERETEVVERLDTEV